MLLDAITFAIMTFVAFTLPWFARQPQSADPAPFAERFGLRQLWNIKTVRLTTILSLVFFFAYGPFEAALPLYSEQILQTDARGYGLLWSFIGIGSLIGTLGSGAIQRHMRLGVALPLIALLWGTTLLPVVVGDTLWFACLFLLLGGLAWGPYTPMETTLLQRSVAKEQLGRVFGARSTLLMSGTPLGLAIGGVMLTILPATALLAFAAVICIVLGVVGLASPVLRDLASTVVDSDIGPQRVPG